MLHIHSTLSPGLMLTHSIKFGLCARRATSGGVSALSTYVWVEQNTHIYLSVRVGRKHAEH